MIIIIGLVILVAAMVAGVADVLSNSGSGHALSGPADVQSARNRLICSWPLASSVGGRLLRVPVEGLVAASHAGARKPAISPVRIPLTLCVPKTSSASCDHLRRRNGSTPASGR